VSQFPESTNVADAKPLLVYDGDCGFCKYWVRYWHQLTGDRVVYQPYQEVGARYPLIPVTEFQRAVHYIAPDGKIATAAEACFLTLSHAPNKSFWLLLYRKIPGLGPITELAYAFIAAHRRASHSLSRLLWGRDYEPTRYDLVSWLFLRGLGLIYLVAFISFGTQAMGLIGAQGILPLAGFVGALNSHLGTQRYWLLPMVFWLSTGDLAIKAVCWTGVALSLLLTFNLLPRFSLFVLYVFYLSLMAAGQTFMGYQWDAFLVETGFLALLLSIATRPGIWLLRWLLFRFIFMSGAVKLLSGDPAWANLSALSYHFLTQPLPTPLAWYAARLPSRALAFATGATLFIEVILPLLIFCPRRLRFVAAFGILLLQTCIALTGNYNFFNLQTMLLCLVLFDDAAVRSVLPESAAQLLSPRVRENHPGRYISLLVAGIAGLIVLCSLTQMTLRFGRGAPAVALAIDQAIAPLGIVNTYGLFAVMTTKRDEIVIEGSDDGVHWKEYAFKYKPGDVRRPPPWSLPFQPRLDWQMWFASLASPMELPWFTDFVRRLLENSPPVLGLMETNPFPGKPPVYVRAEFYDYTFSSPAQKAKGIWWDRKLLGLYYPAVSLSDLTN
jgi:predicted DCC family thiol-disulfide oxidoreductase YuxK